MERDIRADEVEVPNDLKVALSETPGAIEEWQRMSPDAKKAQLATLETARTDLSRARCVEELVRELSVQVEKSNR